MTELLGLGEWASISTLAQGVQNAVEGGKWAYLAVISIFVLIQLMKKNSHVKKNASRYSAGAGATVGAILGADPVSGAVGGLMVGNAASGLYSLLKPIIGGDFLKALMVAVKMTNRVYGLIKAKEKKEILADFDKAIDSTKGENPSTKELEEWFKKNI
jgi:hypothetical protein